MSFRRNLMKICAVGTMVAAMTLTLTVPVGAEDLNDIGGGTSYTQEAGGNTGGSSNGYVSADDFKDIYNSATPSQEEMQAAAEISRPVVKVIRTVMSFLLAVLPALMLLNCIVDILCLTVSPLRKAMLAVHGGGASAGGGMGMGMGGMGMGGMGMGAPAGGSGQPVGVMQWIGQWASKEAVDVAQENGGGGAAAGGGMGMGMGMGGMGMGMGAPAGPAPKAKVLLVEYFKKKTVFLVAFGVCIIVFSCTAFTDLGLEIGEWIVTKIGGISL